MGDSIQIKAKKVSHYLTWGVIIYSIVSTFLYFKFRTNLEDYITWGIILFCGTTVIMAFTKRGLYKFLVNNPYLFSFGKQENALPEPTDVTAIPSTITSEVNDSTKEVVDNAPKTIKEAVAKEEAEAIKAKLEAEGAGVEIK